MLESRMRTGRRLAIVLAPFLAAVLAVAPSGQTAPATSVGWVYVSAPTWLGNCPRGGLVRFLHVSNWGPSVITYAADGGDDIVYLKVALGESNTLVVAPVCYNGTKSWPGASSTHTIRPKRTKQTFWLGPLGQRSN